MTENTPKEQTITIVIGNSDNKLTQQRWSEFVTRMDDTIREASRYGAQDQLKVHCHGLSASNSLYQNACWVLTIREGSVDLVGWLRRAMPRLRSTFDQDGIAFVTGTTEML